MTMRDYTLSDEFGRQTKFRGERLVRESTEGEVHRPRWQEVEVYRTEAGNWVVFRATNYRIRHSHDRCSRADGYALTPARPSDTYPCRECLGSGNAVPGGLGQLSRISVDSYTSVDDLILSFRAQDGVYSALSRAILADLSEQDERVDATWNTVVVP